MSGSTSRRGGDNYQDLYGWFRALELLDPVGKAELVSIEDPSAGFFDDVTIRPRQGTTHPSEFAQVKFHVDLAGDYSASSIIEAPPGKRSLLWKAWESWKLLRGESEQVTLLLITTYSWDRTCPVARHIRKGYGLTEVFIEGRCEAAAKERRERWREHLDSPSETDFQAFLSSLRLRMGFSEAFELGKVVALQMRVLGLRWDEASVKLGAKQVADWIADRKVTIDRADMEEAVDRLGLRLPDAVVEPGVDLRVHTIVREPIDDGDYELDWLDHFESDGLEHGHRVTDPGAWNDVMLPELYDVRRRMEQDTTEVRLLRVRGRARLSAWFAIGWVFRDSTGWTIEVDQNGSPYRTDATDATDVTLEEISEDLGGDAGTLAVAVSVTHDISGDVRNYLSASDQSAAQLLSVRTSLGTGRVIRSAGDLTRIAHLLRDRIRMVLGRRPRRLLLFYSGPAAGAALIAAPLNAVVAGDIQVFEDQLDGYAPSFIFHQS